MNPPIPEQTVAMTEERINLIEWHLAAAGPANVTIKETRELCRLAILGLQREAALEAAE